MNNVHRDHGVLDSGLGILQHTILLCMATTPSPLTEAIHAQLRPQWIQALNGNPKAYKLIFENGRLVRKRALQLHIAVPLVQAWIPAAIEAIRRKTTDISDALAAWDHRAENVIAVADDDV